MENRRDASCTCRWWVGASYGAPFPVGMATGIPAGETRTARDVEQKATCLQPGLQGLYVWTLENWRFEETDIYMLSMLSICYLWVIYGDWKN